jgi:hypothetical protein
MKALFISQKNLWYVIEYGYEKTTTDAKLFSEDSSITKGIQGECKEICECPMVYSAGG